MKTKRRFFAVILAAVFVIINVAAALPVLALDDLTARYPTPEGYNDHDYQKLVAFLEQTDEDGVKNGKKLSSNYDPNDPTTWGTNDYGRKRFQWIEMDGELWIYNIDLSYAELCGTLEVSGCTALESLNCSYNNLTLIDVSNCMALCYLDCSNNYYIEELDLSHNIMDLNCSNSALTKLDLKGFYSLVTLNCSYTCISELNVSKCYSLQYIDSFNCCLNKLDLGDSCIPRDLIVTQGVGEFGYRYWYGQEALSANDYNNGNGLIGWYDENGNLLSTDDEVYLDYMNTATETIIAKFVDFNSYEYSLIKSALMQTDDDGISYWQKEHLIYEPDDYQIKKALLRAHDFYIKRVDDEYKCYGIRLYSKFVGQLYVPNFMNLEWIDIYSTNLTEINAAGCTRLRSVDCKGGNLASLDVRGCASLSYLYCFNNKLTELYLSGCTALKKLDCSNCRLTELDLQDCTVLNQLNCFGNNLTELDLSNNTELTRLSCRNNKLHELDVSGCILLEELDCADNNLTELDLSSNTKLPIDHIYAEGKGYVGYDNCHDSNQLNAKRQTNERFLGWYNEDGELLSTDAEWDITDRTETVFIAKFTGGEPEIIPGDADGDGELTFNDVTALYYYLLNGDMTGMTPESLASADLNNDGVVSVSDITLMFNLLLGGN